MRKNRKCVVVRYNGVRLDICADHSTALSRVHSYPIGAEIVRICDGVILSRVVGLPCKLPIAPKPGIGSGESHAGFSQIPNFSTVR